MIGIIDKLKILDMKKTLLLLVAAAMSFSAVAQTTDSVKLVTAPRQEIKLPKGAEGYVILRAEILDSHQTISVIKYSPKHFTTVIAQPEKLTRLSATAKANGGDFGVNAGY